MAYFDSSKNRALWEIELQSLRKARADRAAGKTTGLEGKKVHTHLNSKEPVRMTYADLLREEAEASRRAPKREYAAVQAEKQRQREQKEVQKEAYAYGKS